MSKRVWPARFLTIALVLVACFLGAKQSQAIPDLRSQHSQLAVRMPSQPVAVTADGKTFHRAGCPFIHGPVKMVDAQTAAREGYVPDPHCMHEALGK
jgi:hypothetical protein